MDQPQQHQESRVMAAQRKVRQEAPVSVEKADPQRRRIQIDFSPQGYQRLTEMKEQSDASSNAELVKNALRVFEWFLDQQKNGAKIFVEKDDQRQMVEFLFR